MLVKAELFISDNIGKEWVGMTPDLLERNFREYQAVVDAGNAYGEYRATIEYQLTDHIVEENKSHRIVKQWLDLRDKQLVWMADVHILEDGPHYKTIVEAINNKEKIAFTIRGDGDYCVKNGDIYFVETFKTIAFDIDRIANSPITKIEVIDEAETVDAIRNLLNSIQLS